MTLTYPELRRVREIEGSNPSRPANRVYDAPITSRAGVRLTSNHSACAMRHHHLAAMGFPGSLSRPGPRRVVERHSVIVEADAPGGGVIHDGQQGRSALLASQLVVGVAEHPQ